MLAQHGSASGEEAAVAATPHAVAGDHRAASMAVSLPPVLADEVFDRRSLLKRCMGDEGLAEKVLARFAQRLLPDLAKIEQAHAQADATALVTAAHGLKGAAANVSAKQLSAAAAELEKLAREGDLVTATQSLDRLRTEIDRCAQSPEIDGLLKTLSP
jgi:HPt (histidine-containing phosphotransfer) domain-containing protein